MTPSKVGTHEKVKPPVVVLCGFMGTGKTAAGRVLAAMLEVPFIDTDAIVESRAGCTIAEIFARDGEDRFRDLEADACASLDVARGAVVAIGGGALEREATFKALENLGTMVLLEAPIDVIAKRTAETSTRPRLPVDAHGVVDMERIASLLDGRRPAYHRIRWRVDTSRCSPGEVAFEIAEQLRHRERIIHLRVETRPIPGYTLRPGEARLSRIVLGRGGVASLGRWIREIGVAGPVFVMSSRRVAGHHGTRVKAVIDKSGLFSRFVEVEDNEESKTLDQAERLTYELTDAGATRDSAVLALGGGVTGDLAGFVAATFMRGIPFVQVPTTLLAQVDASIGGKVGVNHPRAKNLIGAIYQPHLVITDVELLTTLSDRDLASGMAEIIKTAIIGSPALFEQLVTRASDRRAAMVRDVDLLESCVATCAEVKARIVERDPYEHDLRRVLNLGHTVGHALEAAAGFGVLTHGEAVALGMLASVRLAVRRNHATRDFETALRRTIEACGLPLKAPAVDREALVRAMASDKKRRASGLAFILPVAPGDVRIATDVEPEEILTAMDESQEGKPT
jgi:shikimate kinase / 3-dehydroquinate synthase